MIFLHLFLLTFTAIGSNACSSHFHCRHTTRSSNYTNLKPSRPLEWGQINFLHTTDIHGYMGGHHRNEHFRADWGDFNSFVTKMRDKAEDIDVDLLVVDTGDLHDGNGLSDATTPNGKFTNKLFSKLDYDLLTIGNHELMSEQVAYETKEFARSWGDKYLTTNVRIRNSETGDMEYIGSRYRYFTTKLGLRVMAFGLYGDNYTLQTNVVNTTSADDLIGTDWWAEHVESFDKPIDMFIILSHQPYRPSPDIPAPTIWKVFSDIRARRPHTPIQFFGGHTHVRDFAVMDEMATGIESGAFAETVGWVSISGLDIPTYGAAASLGDLPQPTRKAFPTSKTRELENPKFDLKYARRYLDWNMPTFKYHSGAFGEEDDDDEGNDGNNRDRFDTAKGRDISQEIRDARKSLNIDEVLGCVPANYYYDAINTNNYSSVFVLWKQAVSEVVASPTRANKTRYILTNGIGGVSSDILRGNFTRDDSYIAYSGPPERFFYLGDLEHVIAEQFALPNDETFASKRDVSQQQKRDPQLRQTQDDFGNDGDDTPPSETGPIHPPPTILVTLGGYNGTIPEKVDVVVVEPAIPLIVKTLNNAGIKMTADDFKLYMENFTTKDVWEAYAKRAWRNEFDGCKIG